VEQDGPAETEWQRSIFEKNQVSYLFKIIIYNAIPLIFSTGSCFLGFIIWEIFIYSFSGIGIRLFMMFPAIAHPKSQPHGRLKRTRAVSKGFPGCLSVGHVLPKRL
jgi:hypothetical protein